MVEGEKTPQYMSMYVLDSYTNIAVVLSSRLFSVLSRWLLVRPKNDKIGASLGCLCDALRHGWRLHFK